MENNKFELVFNELTDGPELKNLPIDDGALNGIIEEEEMEDEGDEEGDEEGGEEGGEGNKPSDKPSNEQGEEEGEQGLFGHKKSPAQSGAGRQGT